MPDDSHQVIGVAIANDRFASGNGHEGAGSERSLAGVGYEVTQGKGVETHGEVDKKYEQPKLGSYMVEITDIVRGLFEGGERRAIGLRALGEVELGGVSDWKLPSHTDMQGRLA